MKRCLVCASFLLGLGTALWTSPASGTSVGMFADSTCSSCNLVVSLGGTATTFIRIVTDYQTNQGVTGAEFRITGLPPNWLASAIPNPQADSSTGNLFGSGAVITFPLAGIDGDCVDLYTVFLSNYSAASDVVLRVEAGNSAPCPRVFLGNLPISSLCAEGGVMFVNSDGDCRVSVAPTTWSQVKALYQNTWGER